MMLSRFVGALGVAIFMAAGPVTAQQASAVWVEDCFANTPIGEVAPQCLGRAAGACQDAGNDTTLGIGMCIQSETAAWDAILNREYQSVRAAFQGRAAQGVPLPDLLRDAQRAWIAYRDAECGLAYARWADGSIRTIVGANCMMVMTAQRALELRDMKGN